MGCKGLGRLSFGTGLVIPFVAAGSSLRLHTMLLVYNYPGPLLPNLWPRRRSRSTPHEPKRWLSWPGAGARLYRANTLRKRLDRLPPLHKKGSERTSRGITCNHRLCALAQVPGGVIDASPGLVAVVAGPLVPRPCPWPGRPNRAEAGQRGAGAG